MLKARRLFTLVELLLVVAIIGILISILLPSLKSVREKTKRALCLSNQTQLNRFTYAFSKNYNGRAPIGYTGYKQSSYFLTKGNKIHNIGHLYVEFENEIKESLWCPSATFENFQFNTATNTWPPSGNSRAAFNSNPIANLKNRIISRVNENGQSYVKLNGNKYTSMPFIAKMDDNDGMYSDWLTKPTSLSLRHVDGANVTYIDGSGKFLYNLTLYTSVFSDSHSKSYDGAFQNLWDHFKEAK